MMSHYILQNRQVKKVPVGNTKSSQELIGSHRCHEEQVIGICKEIMVLTEPKPEAYPMTPTSRHMDNAPSVPRLSGSKGKAGERDENLSPPPFKDVPHKKPRQSKISLIRTEFVELTNDPLIAAVLNQLVYWSQRVSDFDHFWEEEVSSSHTDISSPQHGWFYKSANELLEETMVRISPITMRRYLSFLMKQGWVQTRVNPRYKWDRTIQYRVNLRKLYTDLQALGFGLPGFPPHAVFPSFQKEHEEKNDSSNLQNLTLDENKIFSTPEKPRKSACVKNDPSNLQNLTFDEKETLPSNETPLHSRMEKNEGCNTENKTKIKNKEHTQRTRACEADQKNGDLKKLEKRQDLESLTTLGVSETSEVPEFSAPASLSQLLEPALEPMATAWKTHVGQEVRLTAERKNGLQTVLRAYFQNDLLQWDLFCKRVGTSPFLMGQGARKWRVSLDWILVEENLLKVLEGNFDDPAGLEQQAGKTSEDARKNEVNAVLASIVDSTWRKCCSQLDFSPESREFVSLMELKSIANAKFLEVEDDRLVWIGSSDRQTLSRIEDLRFKILPLVQRSFPHVRNIRTRLEETHLLHQSIEENPHTISTKAIQQKGENYAE
jgi:hypothetical protein